IGGQAFRQGSSTTANFVFPDDSRGILANVTIIGAAGGGFVTVFPGSVADADRPLASTVNPSTQVAANFTAVAIAPTGSPPNKGTIAVYSTNTTDIAVDVVGIFM